jgi:hypothetical protein
MEITQRRFPYPYQAMLAVSSDTDAMSPWEFIRIHRFLNTRTPAILHYGDGLGLDVGDSFFFKNMASKNGLGVFNGCFRYASEDAWADELGGDAARVLDPKHARDRRTGRLVFENGPRFIEKYIKCGWIEVLHGGDGSWGETSLNMGATDWCRADGQHYMDWMAARGLRIDTFTNHSAVTSDFGVPRTPSTPAKPRSLGDLPSSAAYWADYARRSGIKFYWSYIPDESAAYRCTFGQDTLLLPATFRDGGKFWHFSRYDSRRPYADAIDSILNPGNLDSLVNRRQMEIVYTHLGYWSDDGNHVQPELSQSSIDAFRLLKAYQDDGRILVAGTARLLRYNLARDYLAFTATRADQHCVVDIRAVRDTQFGEFSPCVDDLRGMTFYVADSSRAEIRIHDRIVPENQIQRNPRDETGAESIAIKWFEPDYTDYTTG